MHMADALLSPSVGGIAWAATAVTTVVCSRKVHNRLDDRKVPLMGVLGAFVFAAQMINFAIPGTGVSGHLGGGLLLAILLGPPAAFLVMASVLTVQAVLFADGGLLALGANIINLGFFPCFVAYPLLYKPLAGREPTTGRISLASITAAIVGLQLGALAVVLQTVLSGISELPFGPFALLMQPIHLGIGVVEGLVTAGVVTFVWRARPEILADARERQSAGQASARNVLLGLGAAALLTGAVLSWFASNRPDGLEWSIAQVTGTEALDDAGTPVHESLGDVQEKTSLLPDYAFKPTGQEPPGEPNAVWPVVDPGTSVSGIVGGLVTLLTAVAVGWVLSRRAAVA